MIQIGKTKIEIKVSGCKLCGTQYSRAWYVVDTLTVTIDKKKIVTLEIHICDDCRKAKGD